MSSLIPHDYRYKISSPTPVDKEPDKKSTLRVRLFELERVKRIELSQSAWKAEVLPLNYTRISLAQQRPTLALAYYPRR